MTERLIKLLPKCAAFTGFKSFIIEETKSTHITKVLVLAKAKNAHINEKEKRKIIRNHKLKITNCSNKSKYKKIIVV